MERVNKKKSKYTSITIIDALRRVSILTDLIIIW